MVGTQTATSLQRTSGSAESDSRVLAPGGHGRHVGLGTPLQFVTWQLGIAPLLPRDHPLEALVERLQVAGVVGAVRAVPAGLDRHAAALAVAGGAHRLSPVVPVRAGSGGAADARARSSARPLAAAS